MKTLLISIMFFLSAAYFQQANAQFIKINPKTNIHLDAKKLKAQKKVVAAKEKEKLKDDVKKINQELDDGKITVAKAEEKKKAAAERHAKNIEDQQDIIDANIALLKRNKGKDDDNDYYENMDYLSTTADTTDTDTIPNKTSSGVTWAFGLNNAIGDGQSLDDSPYKIGGSRFFEIGYEFRTVLVNSGFLRVNYGINFQFNGLKPENDQYFVKDGDQTKLEDFQYDLHKAKLRMDNLVIPVHFEIGPTDENYKADHFKLGLGGYAGVNLNTIQKLKYKRDGDNIKNKISNDYNTNNFIYGLSAYIGYDNISLYVKYDLNTIFKDNPIDTHNVAAGLRFGI